MTKNDRSIGTCNSSNQGNQAKKPSRLPGNQDETRAIMKMTTSVPRQDKIKESFKDENNNEIKEYISTYHDGNCKENLLVLEK